MRHVPYGTTKLYQEGIDAADLERLARLIRIVGVLLQTKVYLFLEEKRVGGLVSGNDT